MIFKVTSKSHKGKKTSFLPLAIRHWLHLNLRGRARWSVHVFAGCFGEVASLENTGTGLQERKGQSGTPLKGIGTALRPPSGAALLSAPAPGSSAGKARNEAVIHPLLQLVL